jgi:hypothetical protein
MDVIKGLTALTPKVDCDGLSKLNTKRYLSATKRHYGCLTFPTVRLAGAVSGTLKKQS